MLSKILGIAVVNRASNLFLLSAHHSGIFGLRAFTATKRNQRSKKEVVHSLRANWFQPICLTLEYSQTYTLHATPLVSL